MEKARGALPLAITLFLCLMLIFGAAAIPFVSSSKEVSSVSVVAGLFPLKETGGSGVYEKKPSYDGEKNSSAAQSVQVSASPSDAVGRISELFISPYGAGSKYNGIYMKNATGTTVNIKEELEKGVGITLADTDKPQVLILHTHATETFMTEDRSFYTAEDQTRTTNNQKNVVAVGDRLASVLREGGIGVIHDTTHHDHPAYNGSYSRAAVTINEYLKKYPSIKIVVDLHRDSIAGQGTEKIKPTVTVDGKKAAQVMLVMGSQTGTVSGFENWKENLRLALRFQQTMEASYPGLARPLLLASRIYNENLTTGSMILEVGTEANTLEEALYSAELAGSSLLALLNTLK